MTYAPARPMTLTEWGLLIALATIWGGSFFLNAVALETVPVLTVVAARVGGAALVLWVVVRRMPKGAGIWTAFLAMGLVNNAIPFGLIVWGQQHIASGLASILNATTPLFAVLVAHAAGAERATLPRLAGVAIGLAGVAAMIGVSADEATEGLAGQLACLGAALSYAVAGVFGRRFARAGVAPVQVATGQVTASAALLVPLALAVDGPMLPGPSAGAALIGLATVCTALAYILYFRLLATAGAVNLLLVTLLVPVSAVALGGLLGEALAPRHAAGFAAVALGLALIDGRVLRLRATAR